MYGLTPPVGSRRSRSSERAPTPPTRPASDHPAGKLNENGFAEAEGGDDTAMQHITIIETRDFNSPSAIGAPRTRASRAERTALRSLRKDMSVVFTAGSACLRPWRAAGASAAGGLPQDTFFVTSRRPRPARNELGFTLRFRTPALGCSNVTDG